MDPGDIEVRALVYDLTMKIGRPPLAAELAARLGRAQHEVEAALWRLAESRVVVLADGTPEILMASPFSAVPTAFLVETDGGLDAYGNCIWDALGIPVMLGELATVFTSCGDCGGSMQLRALPDGTVGGVGIVHFAVPARHWWDDIVFT